ncbi:hypothetical protein U9M48_027486 [Paspalum notatum var. saurae]|uniref:No apical meristem-associated C-terminal domain-containing protein n=1 Tax=Paspalum notatum var. saurae TaxID=547442 RepID=A0AAQ3TT18_PASNO
MLDRDINVLLVRIDIHVDRSLIDSDTPVAKTAAHKDRLPLAPAFDVVHVVHDVVHRCQPKLLTQDANDVCTPIKCGWLCVAKEEASHLPQHHSESPHAVRMQQPPLPHAACNCLAASAVSPQVHMQRFHGMFPAREGYFSNLLNEENPNMLFDDFSGPPEDHSSPVVASTPWCMARRHVVHSGREFMISSTSTRTSSISHRWAYIQENVNKFCGCLSRIEDRRQSGVTFQDKSEDSDNKSFQFMHCWNELRNQPKWHEKRRQIDAIKQAPNKKSKVKKNSSPGTATTTIPDSSRIDILENALRKMQETNCIATRDWGEAYKEARIFGEKKEFDAEKEKKKEERFNQSYELELRYTSVLDRAVNGGGK